MNLSTLECDIPMWFELMHVLALPPVVIVSNSIVTLKVVRRGEGSTIVIFVS